MAASVSPGSSLQLLSEHACFGGVQRYYQHPSSEIGLPMRFGIYLPPQSVHGSVPAIVYLAGLTCTEETFFAKAGAQRVASQLGLALISPDTSPREANVQGEADAWDFGVGAGFYLDATQAPWNTHWRMESYLIKELFPLIVNTQPIDEHRLGLMGHSMGGHGALVLALRCPEQFKSLSAFAPICAPTQCPWGKKAFSGYLGNELEVWQQYDASALMKMRAQPLFKQSILIDQGLSDKFLSEQLYPETFEAACADVGQALTLRRHAGYDHGYYFISTFMESHLQHHADIVCAI
jgi:S-formylglutathione hydrolase